ncbi:MAG: M4 family metallopeptidase [Candidatus Latescibacterota bacterium]|nr:M4 family metallopeptidase [Candidatus Latescibacterota bacterium]
MQDSLEAFTPQARLDQMRQRDPELDVSYGKTGKISRLRGLLSDPMTGDGQQVALDFFTANQSLLGMKDASSELSVIRAKTDERGWEVVKLQQIYKTLTVEGFQLVLSIDDQRQVRIVNCRNYMSGIVLNTEESVTSSWAISMVRAHLFVQKESGDGPTAVKLVYPYAGKTHLAWKVRLEAIEPLGEFIYYLDAHTGEILNHYNNMKFALNRMVWDAQAGEVDPNQAAPNAPSPTVLRRSEGGGATGDTDVNKVYDYSGDTYNYFNHANFGTMDSFDDAGIKVQSIVHWKPATDPAGWNNATCCGGTFPNLYARYGDGDGFTFGPLGRDKDIVAHEYGHGVTAFASNLIYQDEPGALNEALSDIYGVEIGKSSATDWAVGETAWTPGTPGDALRMMDNPPAQGQPDHMTSYVVTLDDHGGVHTNSGIPNKAAYLMAAGGTHYGITVTPLDGTLATSRTMMVRIFHRANTTYLTNSSQFNAAVLATQDAVEALFPGDAAKLATVTQAWLAVGLPVNTSPPPRPITVGTFFKPEQVPFGQDFLAIMLLFGCGSYALFKRSRGDA